MTVKKLIELLQKEKPTTLVVISRDAEGNSYDTPTDECVCTGMFYNSLRQDVSDEKASGYKPCIVLYPS